MTKEEEKLLLLDLSARLIYGVQINTPRGIFELDAVSVGIISLKDRDNIFSDLIKHSEGKYWFHIITGDYKPYLRSMSSMTEEEKEELSKRYVWSIRSGQIQIRYHSEGCWDDETECSTEEYIILFDWLNKHHFDYRGLINLGLALEAPKGMYK